MNPISTGEASMKWRLQGTVKLFDHPIGLSMNPWNHTEDMKWTPQSEIRRAGTPNCDIQEEIKALALDSAVILTRGTACGQCKVLLIMVRR